MKSLTINESKVIDFLIRNFRERNSINQLSKKLKLSPRGIYKILKKLESMKAIIPENIGNAIYYKINLNDEIGIKLSEWVLVQNELNSYAQVQAEDLKPLKEISKSCILFGSVFTKGKDAKDIDIMLVIDEKDAKLVHINLDKIKNLKPKKIHELLQTKSDLERNIKKNDKMVLNILSTGKVLWGAETIVKAIKNAC